MFKTDTEGVMRWDGVIVVRDKLGALLSLTVQVEILPEHRGAHLVLFDAEGIQGAFVTKLHRWCKALHNDLQIEAQVMYTWDCWKNKADTHNICLLSTQGCLKGFVPPIDCTDCELRAF